jgi:hypothetical protein
MNPLHMRAIQASGRFASERNGVQLTWRFVLWGGGPLPTYQVLTSSSIPRCSASSSVRKHTSS